MFHRAAAVAVVLAVTAAVAAAQAPVPTVTITGSAAALTAPPTPVAPGATRLELVSSDKRAQLSLFVPRSSSSTSWQARDSLPGYGPPSPWTSS